MAHIREFATLVALPSATTTTSGNGAAVDLSGYLNDDHVEMAATLNVGTITGTQGTFAVKVQESDTTTSADFTDIAGATFAGVTTATGGQTIFFNTGKRYIRLVETLGGTSPSYVRGATVAVLQRLV